MKLLLYVRLSKSEAGSHSLEGQEAALRAYCAAYGHEVVDVVRDDGESGKNMRRPGLERALAALAAGAVDGLAVYKLDRLTRSIRDFIDLVVLQREQKWELHSVMERLDTSTAMGRFFAGMMALMAQWERETISERTRAGLARARLAGKQLGRPSKARLRGASGEE